MRTTIDSGGRVVIPKAIRDAAGLEAGAAIDVEFRDGRIEIEVPSVPMRLVKRGPATAIEPEAELPPLTPAAVREVLDSIRR
jgi:AbrB family looped-hinge helix DNA binding protein